MSALINQRVRPNLSRLILWHLAFTSILSLSAGAQSADQPFDTSLDLSLQANAAPDIVISGVNVVSASIPGSSLEQYSKAERTLAPVSTALSIAINYGGLFNFYKPISYERGGAWAWTRNKTSDGGYAIDNDTKKITFNVMGGQDEGYQADLLQFFVSAPDAKFVVATHIQKTVWFKPSAAQAPPYQETLFFTTSHEFDTLAEARAAIPTIDAAAFTSYSEPTQYETGNGKYIGDVGPPTVYSTVRANAWELLVAATVNKKAQPITGEIVFDIPQAQGRQIAMERWTFLTNIHYKMDPLGLVKVSAKVSNDLELQSFEPIDVPGANLAVELQPLVSTKTISVNGNPLLVTLMNQDEGTKWKAVLGREGVQFVVKGASLLSPITKMEIQALPPRFKDWVTIPNQDEISPPTKIGYYSLVSPIAALGQNTIMQTVSVCLGGLGTDPERLIPPDQSLAGERWTFRANITNKMGQRIYSQAVKIKVVLPIKTKTVQGQTLPPAQGSDGGNGWFAASPSKDYTFNIWTFGLPE